MTGSGGVSSTPQLLDSIINGSGILDHPLSRMMTARDVAQIQTTTTLTVIASEAKQSIVQQRKGGLLRRFAPRNDGRHSFAISRHIPRSAATLRHCGMVR
jgi:hypothetical protein